MSPNAIYSKSGKGVQEASGKTSTLSRGDRAVLSAIDGKMTVAEVAAKLGRAYDPKFEQLIEQLDRDGFVRQVSAGTAPAVAKPAAAAPKAAAPGEDLDFTIAMPAPKAAPKPSAAAPAPPVAPDMAKSQAAAFAKAREEAEEKAARERERIKAEAEARMRAELEAKARSEAERKMKSDAEAKLRAEADAKVKAAREAAVKAAAEAKARAEAEAAVKLEAERAKAREEAERIRKEAEEAKRQAEEARRKAEEERRRADEERRKAEEEARRAREEAEAKARAEAEEARRQAEEARRKAEEEARKAREEAERIRKEAEEAKRQAEEARRKAEEEARRAREEAERQAKAEAERRRQEEEQRRKEEEQRRRAEDERRAREDAERKARDKAEREARDKEDAERRARDKAEREARESAEAERAAREKEREKEKEKTKTEPASFGDSLLADLDSFSDRQEEERKAKEEASRKEKEAAARRAKEEAELREKEEAERREKERRAEEERRRKDEEERRLREEEERTREAIRRAEEERQEAERRRESRRAETAKAQADDDIPLSDEDLDLDDVKQDEALLSKESRRAAREREEREKRAKKEAKKEAKRAARDSKDKEKDREPAWREAPAAPPPFRRPRKWGKPVAVTFFLLLVAGVGALHVVPLSTKEYEAAASAAAGRPVRIGSARLSLYSGVMLKFDGVAVGDAKIAAVRAYPEIGSLFGDKKAFSRIELRGVTAPQAALGALFGAKVRAENFSVERIHATDVTLSGPLRLPKLEATLALDPDGTVTSTQVSGPEGFSGKLTPKGPAEMEFDLVAHSFTVPIVPDMALSGFAAKGTATPEGVKIDSWGGSSLDGAVQGSADVRWAGGSWTINGVMTVRGINAAVFAPALLSEGRAEGTGRFSFSDPDPMAFLGRGRIEGTFSVHKGVLGSFDLSRAIQTGGRQAGGRTPFTGMSGQGVFDKGAVALRNVSFGAGALNAGASADISPEGQLSGRIVADVRTPSQTLRATLNLGGTVRDPQVRN